MENQIFISVNETAKRLSCGVTLIYEQINAGCYRSVKIGKKRLIDVESLNRFASSLANESGKDRDGNHA